MEVQYPNFAHSALKLVSIATSLQRSENEGQTDHYNHISTNNENSVQIGPA